MSTLARKEPVTRENGVLIFESSHLEQRAYWFDDGGIMLLTWELDIEGEWDSDTDNIVNVLPDGVPRLRAFLAQPRRGGHPIDVTCPTCRQNPGWSCVTLSDRVQRHDFHASRKRAVRP